MLTGKHPFYQKDDNEHTYKQRIASGSLSNYLNKFFEKYTISELAQSLLIRLLARGIPDRYRVVQALEHPWITRQFQDKVPQTQNEKSYSIQLEIKFKKIQSVILFAAITKQGHKISKYYYQTNKMNKFKQNLLINSKAEPLTVSSEETSPL